MELTARLPFRLRTGVRETTDFDLNPEMRPKNRPLKPAAVLIPLMAAEGSWDVILTRRSAELADHPGQIAFPGGKVDAGDGTALNAALREAREEIGLPSALVHVIGDLPRHETVTGYSVTPYVGVVTSGFVPRAEAGEVDEVFRVPIHHLIRAENFSIQSRIWMGTKRSYYTVPFGPYYIWGATARMLRNLCDSMDPVHD